mgnify:CR=1 FL=1
MERRKGKSVYRTIRDYVIITIAMLLGVIGVNVFLVPNQITTGGIVGIASIVYWGTGIPVQNTYFVLNALLLIAAPCSAGASVPRPSMRSSSSPWLPRCFSRFSA